MVWLRINTMESLCPNRQSSAAAPIRFSSYVVIVALTLVSPGKAQMLMNLAPQALPNNPVGPTYAGTLDAVKQRLNSPGEGGIQSKQTKAPATVPEANPTNSPRASSTAKPAGEFCELKVFHMNDIQHRKVVRVHSGPCLMVFNAND
jgi:hypothetical protein